MDINTRDGWAKLFADTLRPTKYNLETVVKEGIHNQKWELK